MAQVKILDGDTLEWSAFNDMEKEPIERQPGTVTLKPTNSNLLVEWTDVYDDVVSRREPNIVLLDARPKDMYTGGWSHWGNELTLPVVEGDEPYSGDYDL
jgi:thiosulfate/3-mercaptopyruvate sulfurtransferase